MEKNAQTDGQSIWAIPAFDNFLLAYQGTSSSLVILELEALDLQSKS